MPFKMPICFCCQDKASEWAATLRGLISWSYQCGFHGQHQIHIWTQLITTDLPVSVSSSSADSIDFMISSRMLVRERDENGWPSFQKQDNVRSEIRAERWNRLSPLPNNRYGAWFRGEHWLWRKKLNVNAHQLVLVQCLSICAFQSEAQNCQLMDPHYVQTCLKILTKSFLNKLLDKGQDCRPLLQPLLQPCFVFRKWFSIIIGVSPENM